MDDYPTYLKQADVVISPLLDGWGSPTKIFEALSCGKTTIATPVGARSVDRDYQSLHICEVDQFPEMICRALKKGDSVTTVDFEKLKERHSWRVNIKKLADLIDTRI